MKSGFELKIHKMVSLRDVENLLNDLESLYKEVPKLDSGKDVISEVSNLVEFSKSSMKWFEDFSRFIKAIHSGESKEYMEGDSSLDSLIKRART
jgi:hypothetical protein